MGKGEIASHKHFFFSHNVFKSCLLLMHQSEYLRSKGLKFWIRGRKFWLPAFSPVPKMFSKVFFFRVVKNLDCVVKAKLTHSQPLTLFDAPGKQAFENTVGKGEIARNECFLPVWIAFCHFH